MYPILLHIYGPFNINSFSIAIAIALFVALIFSRKKALKKNLISEHDFTNGFVESALIGIFGGRLLHILSEWKNYLSLLDMISIWNGGMSVLGSFIGVIAYASWYVRQRGIPILPLFDCVALYAPLAHSIARFGCFLAGCCYGIPTSLWWGVTYTNPEVVAPLHIQLHPTQLYSSLSLMAIFLILRKLEKRCVNPGELTMLYLILASIERLSIDFLRGDRVINSPFSFIFTQWLSLDQWIAVGMFIMSLTGLFFIKLRAKRISGVYEPF